MEWCCLRAMRCRTTGLPCCDALFRFFERKVAQAQTCFLISLPSSAGFFIGFLAEAVIRAAPFHEQVGIFAEQAAPLGLDMRADRAAGRPGLRHGRVHIR